MALTFYSVGSRSRLTLAVIGRRGRRVIGSDKGLVRDSLGASYWRRDRVRLMILLSLIADRVIGAGVWFETASVARGWRRPSRKNRDTRRCKQSIRGGAMLLQEMTWPEMSTVARLTVWLPVEALREAGKNMPVLTERAC